MKKQYPAGDTIVTETETFPQWDRNPRMPGPPPPQGACDSQFHIYGDTNKYPPIPNTFYQPPDATFWHMKTVLEKIGFQRGVIVYPMPYGTDSRLLIDVLEAIRGTPDERNFRATCIVKDDSKDSELAQLDSLGVVGARFNIGKKWEENHTFESIRRNLERVRDLGWHARLHVSGEDLLDYADLLLSVKGLTYSVDHMCHLHFEEGLQQPAMKLLLELLQNENWWIMVSNGCRVSNMEEGWDDAVPFGRAMVRAAPDRVIWGTDWPHVKWRKQRMMNEAEPVELLYRYVDGDQELLRKILVDNPVRLHGFEP
jgi:2-pyrone-4,6-dicarboxylate lactonase